MINALNRNFLNVSKIMICETTLIEKFTDLNLSGKIHLDKLNMGTLRIHNDKRTTILEAHLRDDFL